MNRGSLPAAPDAPSAVRRFNEAPIHESGKYIFYEWSGVAEKSFNEAPIHESGKYVHDPLDVWRNRASMRPRFMNRGSARPSRIALRMADRFNEAPIHESGKYQRRAMLCLRHDPASMRPRFMNRGSAAFLRKSTYFFEASMRPRFMNRGSTRIQLSIYQHRRLQ